MHVTECALVELVYYKWHMYISGRPKNYFTNHLHHSLLLFVSDRVRQVCRGRLVLLEVMEHREAMVTQVNREEKGGGEKG